ncbi:tetratricopeptide repeat-containing sensor histidine kinase [Lacinutrix venerupis]|uniref:Tetratricopeptide repeat protein n=1 Tax=Lacinutrix venerupis TaxID=1486034 RepID=A0AAC9LKW1_9FLAO|nr:tetratricopeptide repeat protein [Lacinutrix venerupis]APY00541.1 hypothetical protein BWR22_09490 [Lacinutrix venerupis]
MKTTNKSFLFFCLLYVFINPVLSQNTLKQEDSIAYFYNIARDKHKNFESRLHAVSTALKLIGNNTQNSYYLKTLSTKSYIQSSLKQTDSALISAKLLLEKSIEQKEIKMKKSALKKLARYNRDALNFVTSYNYHKKVIDISLKTKDTLSVVQALQFISSIQNIIGFPFESEASAVECLSLLDKLNNTSKVLDAKVGIYNQLGIIYKDLKNYNRALMLYDKALAITTNKASTYTLLNNKANVYREMNQLEQAEKILKDVYNKSLKLENNKIKNRVLDNLGFVQSKLNQEIAIKNLKKALQNRELENDEFGIYTSCMHIGQHYLNNNNYNNAKTFALRALNIAEKLKSKSYTLDALALLNKLSDHKHVTEYVILKDSIQEAKLKSANKYTSIKYDYAKQELIAKENELEKEKEKRLKFIYLAGIILLIISAAFLYFIIRAKHKKENLQQVFTTEARISKKVHDEVANDVYQIMTKLQSNKNTLNNETVLDDLETIYIKTRDISRENNSIEVEQDFEQLLTDLLLSFKSQSTNIITQNLSNIDWTSFSELKKMTIYRVLQELLVNMKKHSEASFVIINFSKQNHNLIINYKDNGKGAILKKANGLENVENRIAAIKGTVTFETESNKGFKAVIKV